MPIHVLQLGQKLAKAFNLNQNSLEMAKIRLRFREIGQKHLDLSVTMGNQSTATLSRIEQELKAIFAEFNDAELGGLGLELSMSYIKTYWGDQRTQGRGKHQAEDETKDGKSPANEYTDDDDKYSVDFGSGEPLFIPPQKNSAPESSTRQRNKAEPKPTRHAQPGASFFVPSANFNFSAAPAIKVFLESFTPSLLYLYPTFVQAGITNQKALDCLASWPRFNLAEFLGGLKDPAVRLLDDPAAAQTMGKSQEKGKGQGQEKLKKVVVEALVLRLKASDYED